MRIKYLIYLATIVVICTYIGTSCKKPVHSSNPTPNNSRLLSYTKITTITNSLGGSLITPSTVNENYRFYYDDLNRVNRIIFTSNDSFQKQLSSVFTYASDSVFKAVTNVMTNSIIERDTFIYNSLKQLTTAYTPHLITSFQYYGKLLATYSMTSHSDSGILMSTTSTYTSVNGDLLAHNYDGTLTATLPSRRYTPFSTAWYPGFYRHYVDTFVVTGTGVPHTGTGYTDVYTNYNEAPIMLTSNDYYNKKDTGNFPGALWRKESYHFYTEMPNRIGDYLTIQSFTKYGYNVYQNSHLVEEIISVNRHANISYNIDAYNNITQANVVTLDSVLNKYSDVYNFQYETF